ncbi:RICIN domain-containing protein [Amycolatopsis sp. YIM 10]|uniref:RICIN domain-containing protein n=1 Tax=Amycolatopsis sp. YIM 10 TaxID=2653857 RepID=UPI00128FE5C7|nr:RICIN domain-containing protein [Amycolatopsis sp. YIM 10]QFU91751.1 Ricin-type beta-trefoil lectin domain protein [Amycolatopsis sp. YIM 10]
MFDKTARVVTQVIAAALLLLALGVPASAGTGAAPVAPAAVGSRLINGDGDTSGRCLEISGGGTGTWVQMAGCHTNAHQSWYFTPHTGGVIAVRSHDADVAGECLSSGSSGVQAAMGDCVTNGVSANQAWYQTPVSNGWFKLRNKLFTNLCLEVANSGQSTRVQSGPCGASNQGNQLWHWHTVG